MAGHVHYKVMPALLKLKKKHKKTKTKTKTHQSYLKDKFLEHHHLFTSLKLSL